MNRMVLGRIQRTETNEIIMNLSAITVVIQCMMQIRSIANSQTHSEIISIDESHKWHRGKNIQRIHHVHRVRGVHH